MSLSLRPLDDSGFGAVVDCHLATEAEGLSPQLERALHQHRLLVVPRQHLTHADLLTVASCFGTVDPSIDRRYAVGGFPGLTVISNIVEVGEYVGIYNGDDEEEWHVDNRFKPQLTAVTLLYSVITPKEGGETCFADATRAYACLPPADREDARGCTPSSSSARCRARPAAGSRRPRPGASPASQRSSTLSS
ncbi:TauD/TfdA dioxygenase family protein [Streptomyces bobili]|uniref:TauD/TfdA dioxygenase family protein n=1 Tax=Streptomyces bobili TaxID=67280 RepID=UPI0037FDFBED